MPSGTVLVSGPAVGAAQIPIWSYSCVFLPPMSTAVSTSAFSFEGPLSGLLCIPQTQSLPGWSCGFNLQLVQLVGRCGSSYLVTLPLGFNCGFNSTSACGRPLSFAPEAALEGLGLPLWGQVWRWCSCLGRRVLAAPGTRGVGGQGSRKYSALEGYGDQYWPIRPSILAWRTLLPDREAWQATVYRSQRVAHYQSDPTCIDARLFFLWQLCPSESWVWRWFSYLACRGAGSTRCSGTWTASTTGVMTLSESFFEPLVAGDQ